MKRKILLVIFSLCVLFGVVSSATLPARLDCKLTYNPPITYTFSVFDRITRVEQVLFYTHYEGQIVLGAQKPYEIVFPCAENKPKSLFLRLLKR